MFNHIRRHQKWLWILISAAVIISFVVYFNPATDFSSMGGGGRAHVGTIDGKEIPLSAYREAELETVLSLYMQYGQWPDRDDMMRQMRMVERQTPNRLFLLHKADELGIEVTDAAAANWISQTFRDPQTKTFRKEAFDQFVTQRLGERGISRSQFNRFVRHQVAIEHLVSVAGASGRLIPPQEAEAIYRQQNEEVEAQVVLFQGTNYLAQVQLDPAAVTQYYSNNAATYRKPERLVVNFVEFPLSNHFAKVDALIAQQTNLQQQIDAVYATRGTNYYTDTNGAPMTAEAAKAQIRSEVREEQARREARNAAAAFLSKLLDVEPRNPQTFLTLAASEKLQVQVSAPFSQFDRPTNIQADLRNAFMLTAEEPFLEEPLLGPDSVYVVGFKQKIPSELPPLDAVRQQVVEDYQETQSATLARNAGQAFQRAVTNSVAQGQSFEQAAQGAGLRVIKLAPFAQATPTTPELPENVDFSSIKNVAFALQPGEVSSFSFTRDGGFVLQVTRRLPVSDNKMKMEFPNFLTQLRRTKQNEAFGDWFQKQMEITPMNLAGMREGGDEPATATQ
ncbi:MAG TPA: SurA N-terminal domain-containing protein [Methylomirabilota bacterium]|nr:SurA N-terminal domain-containing protein [Methylomirabilota bacterium]